MSGTLVEVDGIDTSGTTEFIYYDNGGTYSLLGRASNATAAVATATSSPIWSYAALVYLPTGETLRDIDVCWSKAGLAPGTVFKTQTVMGVPKNLPAGVDKKGYIALTAAPKNAAPVWAEHDMFVV